MKCDIQFIYPVKEFGLHDQLLELSVLKHFDVVGMES